MKVIKSFGILLYTLFLYVGLPMLGWGFDDLHGFYSVPQFVGYAASIAFFGVLVGYFIHQPRGVGNLLGKGQKEAFISRQRIIRLLITALLFGALIFVPFADRRGIGVLTADEAMRWSGMILVITGMGLILWSGLALGRLYSPEVTLQENHHLVTDGPYRLVRHPRYLGGVIQGIGLSLLFRTWIGLILVLVFVLVISFRIRDEERLMRDAFGAEWTDYCKKSWRLLPMIY